MSWMATQPVYSVVSSRSTRGQRAARLSVARLQKQSAGAGLDVETKRSALGAHLSVNTYWWATVAAAQQQQQQQSVTLRCTKYQDKLNRHVSPPPDQRKTVRVGSGSWILRAVQRTQRISSRHQTTTTAVGLGVCSHLCEHSKSEQKHTMTGDERRELAGRTV